MIPRVLLSSLVIAVALSAGCVFGKKSEKRKEGAIASEVEESFKQRWLEKRTAELVARGEGAEFARGQAAREFREKFEFNGPAKK
jgi:hypothetical protein